MEKFNIFNETVELHRAGDCSEMPLECLHALMEFHMGHGGHHLLDFTEAVTAREFLYGDLDVSILKRAIEAHGDYPDTFEGFLEGYLGKEAPVNHGTSVWPVILDEDEIIADGWHRFASYASLGMQKIPVLIYQ